MAVNKKGRIKKKGRAGYQKKYTKLKLLKALDGSGGIISTVAERLGCEWHTAEKYINKYPETIQKRNDENEILLDNAESVLHNAISGGDVSAVKYLLSTKGKSRGYVERIENTGKDGKDLIPEVNLKKLTESELVSFHNLLEKASAK